MDPEPTMTDHRKAALANVLNAQNNVNQAVTDLGNAGGMSVREAILLSGVIANIAQVFATLDLADAAREASHA